MDIDVSLLKELVTEIVVVKDNKLQNYIDNLGLEEVEKTETDATKEVVDIFDVFDVKQKQETEQEITLDTLFKHDSIITTDLLKKLVFERQLKNELANKMNKYSQNLYASHIANECIRAIVFSYYGLTNFKVKTNFKSIFYTIYGDIIQNVIEVLVGFTDKKCKISKEINVDIKINGEIDGAYYSAKDDGIVLVEIKTINDLYISDEFVGRENDWLQVMYYLYLSLQYQNKLPINKPFKNEPNIITNAQKYKYLLDNSQIKYIQLWYVGREFEIKCITTKVDVDNQTFKKYIDYFDDRENEIVKHVQSKLVPDITHKHVNKNKCTFCIYKDYCYANPSELNIIDSKDIYSRLKTKEE